MPQHYEGHIWWATATDILKGENLKAFLLREGMKQGCTFSPLSFTVVSEVLDSVLRQEKEKQASKLERKR